MALSSFLTFFFSLSAFGAKRAIDCPEDNVTNAFFPPPVTVVFLLFIILFILGANLEILTLATDTPNCSPTALVISNLEKIAPKTKMAVNLLQKLKVGKSTLLILEQNKKNIKLAMRNIPDVNVDLVDSLNAYEVLSHKNLMFEKLAIAKFQ